MLSCSEEDSSSVDTASSDTSSSSAVTVSGKVQKGPYVQGTEITVRELDSSMIPTGNTFTGTIDDNTGSFSIKGTLANKIAELAADGYYFNEVSGSLSTAKLSLQALSDVTDTSSVNVNLMTHLEKKRVEYLMDSEKLTFAAAKTQAQTEIMKIFNIDNVTLGNSESLDISKSGDGNAVLLAISAILQSDKTEAELTELLSTINTDIRTDGTLDSSTTKATLVAATNYINPRRRTIRTNIENRYNSLGISATIPAFESYAFKLDTVGLGFGLCGSLKAIPHNPNIADNTSVTGDDADHKGSVVNLSDLGNGIVEDLVTGLKWEKASNQGAAYAGSNEIAKTYCENLTLGGLTWRLPDACEIFSIVDYSDSTGLFYSPIEWNSGYGYWIEPGTSSAVVNYISGIKLSGYSTSGDCTLCSEKCVSGHSVEQKKYFEAGNDTVYDYGTKYTWQIADSINKYDWAGAINYCENLTLDNNSDWRLPDVFELLTLYDPEQSSGINSSVFTVTMSGSDQGSYWTSTEWSSQHGIIYSFGNNFNVGNPSVGYTKSSSMLARCVRGGL
jgi:hypothetical protein